MVSVEDKIYARIVRKGRGWVMVNRDFLDLAKSSTVDWSLFKLKEKGVIRPVLRGVYDYPVYSKLLQEFLAPDIAGVAHAIARKNQWHIQISGSAALNFLGLSTQIPMSTVFYSDGPSRSFMIGERKLQFKHKVLKESKLSSSISEVVVQALSELGEEYITDDVIAAIRNQISIEDRKKLLRETQYIRTWIRNAVEQVCKEEAVNNG